MEIRVSRRALAWLVRGGVLLPGALVSLLIFGLLGAAVTPYDAAGNPVLLSPDLLAADAYRDRAAGWATALRALYLDLYALLENGGRDLYGEAVAANTLWGRAKAVAEAVAVAPSPPPAMAELYQDADATARACLEAARLSAAWAGAPGAAPRAAAVEALAAARDHLQRLEANPWLEQTARTGAATDTWHTSPAN